MSIVAPLLLSLAACGDDPLAPLDSARFESLLADSAVAAGLVGVQAAVLVPGRQPWIASWGHDDTASALSNGALMSVGQVTQSYVGALILQLAEEGALDLDDSLGRYLAPAPFVPRGATIRQLLAHRSGIYPYSGNPYFYSATQVRERDRIWTPADLLGFVGTPLFPVGAQWQPSNTNFVLLGMIAETVRPQTLDVQLERRFFGPLGLAATWLSGPSGAAPGRGVAHSWTGSPGTDFTAHVLGPSVHTSRWASMGAMATAGDLARWAAALFGGSAITAGARAQLLTIGADDAALPEQTGAGLGVRRYALLGRVQYGHHGSVENGSALVVWDEASGITVAVTINQPQTAHGSAQFRLVPALLEAALAEVTAMP